MSCPRHDLLWPACWVALRRTRVGYVEQGTGGGLAFWMRCWCWEGEPSQTPPMVGLVWRSKSSSIIWCPAAKGSQTSCVWKLRDLHMDGRKSVCVNVMGGDRESLTCLCFGNTNTASFVMPVKHVEALEERKMHQGQKRNRITAHSNAFSLSVSLNAFNGRDAAAHPSFLD